MTDFYTPQKDQVAAGTLPAEQPGLPRVLLVGDSISQGYTRPVAELLRGECNVRRPRANCGDTRLGLERLDEWLAGVHWELVHFNWGLHDLCHRHPDSPVYGNRDKINGAVSVPLDEYRANLERLVARLKPHADRLVWASTTVVPPKEAGRHQGDDERYNHAASEIMARHGVPTNDLYALTASFGPDLFVGPGDVHFTDAGSAKLAERVAACIRAELAKA